MLKKLGLGPSLSKRKRNTNNNNVRTPSTKKKKKATPLRKKVKKILSVRKSQRLKGVKVENYLKEKVIVDDTKTKEEVQRYVAKKKKQTTDEIMEKSRNWLKETKKLLKMNQIKSEVGSSSSSSNNVFKTQAIQKWGEGVLLCPGASSDTFDWETYYLSRLSTPPPTKSPQLLLQEYYNDDPWKLLCACALMSRVSSAKTKEKAIKLFFEHYPDPTSCIDANPTLVHQYIAPLGLFENRFRSIVEISRKFLSIGLVFNVGLTPEFKIYGIGEFGVDSFQLFCRDVVGLENPNYTAKDKNLQRYIFWRKKNL